MKELTGWIARWWNTYRYRFVPWMMLNLKNEDVITVRHETGGDYDEADLANRVEQYCRGLHQYPDLRDNLDLYDKLHAQNQDYLVDTWGFRLERSTSNVAGLGVFVAQGTIPQGSLACFYPGTVYQPYQPIFFQSIGNQFLFRCADGVLLDGNDRAVSRAIFRSCAGRDQVGCVRVCDTSWLTPRPVNPLAIGQYVNNSCTGFPANVCYQELNLSIAAFPLNLRKFIPNIHFSGGEEDRGDLRLVVLMALRDIDQGEELFSNYFTFVKN